jgi:hypothetical protein
MYPYVSTNTYTVLPGIPDSTLRLKGLTIEPTSLAPGQIAISKQQAETIAVRHGHVGSQKVVASMIAKVSSSSDPPLRVNPRVNCVCWVVSLDPGDGQVTFDYVMLNASDGEFVFGSSQGGTALPG